MCGFCSGDIKWTVFTLCWAKMSWFGWPFQETSLLSDVISYFDGWLGQLGSHVCKEYFSLHFSLLLVTPASWILSSAAASHTSCFVLSLPNTKIPSIWQRMSSRHTRILLIQCLSAQQIQKESLLKPSVTTGWDDDCGLVHEWFWTNLLVLNQELLHSKQPSSHDPISWLQLCEGLLNAIVHHLGIRVFHT